jgi:hypothetical protein
MTMLRLAVTGTALFVVVGCADGGDTTGPNSSTRAVRSPAPVLAVAGTRLVPASGHFDAVVDFTTISLTPQGANCLLEVSGRLVFSGTIVGDAIGRTTALVKATCAEVAASPPGTYRDVFQSQLEFEGTVDGKPASAHVLYLGQVQPGGQIEGRLVFSRGVDGKLEVDARVAVGGEYRGSVIVK